VRFRYKPFLDAGKTVFHIEYLRSVDCFVPGFTSIRKADHAAGVPRGSAHLPQ